MAARPRKSKEIKKVEGTYRQDRDNPDAPEGTQKQPSPPTWLSKNGKKQFKDLASTLLNLGVLRHEDRFFLSTLCSEYASYTELVQYLNEHGHTYMVTSTQGEQVPKKRPEADLAATKSAFITKSLRELGLTPTAREKVSSTNKKEEKKDPLQEYQELQVKK